MLAISLMPWKSRVRESDADEFNPGTAVTRFRSEMDQLFDRFFEPFWPGESRVGSGEPSFGWAPSLDVTENENEVIVRAEVPGVDADDLDITISGDLLSLSGEKKESAEEERGDYYYAERRFGTFRRQIRLPTTVDRDRVNAGYENGVLTIRMKKTRAAKPKRIPVTAAKS